MDYKHEKRFFTVLIKFNDYSADISSKGFTTERFIGGVSACLEELFPECKICIYYHRDGSSNLTTDLSPEEEPCGIEELKQYIGSSRKPISGKSRYDNPLNENWKRFILFPVYNANNLFAIIVVGGEKEFIKPFERSAGYLLDSYSGELERLINTEKRFQNIVRKTKIDFIEKARDVLRTRQIHESWYSDWHCYNTVSGCDFSNLYKNSAKIWYSFLCTVTTNPNNRLYILMMADTVASILVKRNAEPSEIIKRLQQLLLDKMNDCYLSVLVVRYSAESRKIEIAGAGDCVVLKFTHDDQKVSQLYFGDAIGYGTDTKIHTSQFTIDSGDILCTFTDGVTSAQKKNGGILGSENIRSELLNSSTMSAKTLSARLGAMIDEYCITEENFDDRSLQVIKFS
ncbi:MAG: serine/threonine-protein phosphatase [Treponema sp.]|jgi:hypothetical protein|nr:serine/threonine-protein phosphatase [Treponema sp.]